MKAKKGGGVEGNKNKAKKKKCCRDTLVQREETRTEVSEASVLTALHKSNLDNALKKKKLASVCFSNPEFSTATTFS